MAAWGTCSHWGDAPSSKGHHGEGTIEAGFLVDMWAWQPDRCPSSPSSPGTLTTPGAT